MAYIESVRIALMVGFVLLMIGLVFVAGTMFVAIRSHLYN